VKTFWSKLLIQHTPDRRFCPNPRRRASRTAMLRRLFRHRAMADTDGFQRSRMVAALFQQRLDSPLVRGIPGSPRGETAAMSGWHPITTPIPVLPREGADIVSVPAAALRRALDEAMRVMTAVEARLDQALTGVFPDHLRAPAIDLMLNGYNGRYDELRERDQKKT